MNRDVIEEIIGELREYFDQRADAEYFTDRASPVPNEEMTLLVMVDLLRKELDRGGVLSPPHGNEGE